MSLLVSYIVIVQMDWIESAAYEQSLFCMIVLRLLTVRWLVKYFEYTIFKIHLNQCSSA